MIAFHVFLLNQLHHQAIRRITAALSWSFIFALVYYRTGNLFAAIGIHPFMNTPTILVGPADAGIITAVEFGVVMPITWPRVGRRGGDESPPETDNLRQQRSH